MHDVRKLPCPTVMRMMVQYDSESGLLSWRKRPAFLFKGISFSKETDAKRWNTRYATASAFTDACTNGYLGGGILKTAVLAHRVAWVIEYGFWPTQDIDHINRDRRDNRIENLRLVSSRLNALNRGANKSRGDHPKGVFRSTGGNWMARLAYKRKPIHGGTFPTIELAAAKYQRMHERLTRLLCECEVEPSWPVVADMLAGELTP